MTIERVTRRMDAPPMVTINDQESRTVVNYKRRFVVFRRAEIRLRTALARNKTLLRQKEELIQQQALLSGEFDHRLLNDLQMVVSLLSLQSRASENAEVASQLAVASDRIATIGRIHRRLHYRDGVQSVAFKQFLGDLCRDFSTMLAAERVIVVEGVEIELPSITAIPLSLIVNELMTNAAKYGEGQIRIRIRLKRGSRAGYALSVSNDGPSLPEEFNLAASTGLGMRIIRSFVERIGGALLIGRGDNNHGTRFTVQFS